MDPHKKTAFRPPSRSAIRCPEVAVIGTTATGVIVSWTPAAETIFGYAAGEATGQPVSLLEPEGDGGPVRQVLDRVRHGVRVDDFVATCHAKGGLPVEVSLSVSPIWWDAEGRVTGISIAAQDVGRRRRAESLGARLVDAFERAGTAIAVVHGPGATLELVNPAFARLHGSPVDALMNRSLLEVVSPDAREEVRSNLARVSERGRHVFSTRLRRKDGTDFFVLVDGAAVNDARGQELYQIVSVHALSDGVDWLPEGREGSPLAGLERRTRLLETLLESATDLIFIKDREGRYVLASPSVGRLWRLKPESLLGKRDHDVFPAETADQAAETDHEVLTTGHRTEYDLNVIVDGSPRVFHAVKVPLLDHSGSIQGLLGISRDVTEERQLRADLEARVAERTLQLGAFTYTVAHDLRAPLRAMVGLGQIVLQDYGDRLDETGRAFLRRISEAASRMDLLIRDLLHYSQLTDEPLPSESIDLADVVDSILTEMDPQLQAAQAIVTVGRPLHQVRGHRAGLNQVFYHLVSNAVKFVAPGIPPRVHVCSEERGDRVRLWVEDNGLGIPPEYHDRIFRVFEHLHLQEDYPGTGMGLAIAKKAVEQMGGWIGVESGPGNGSRFWVDLPKGDEATKEETT